MGYVFYYYFFEKNIDKDEGNRYNTYIIIVALKKLMDLKFLVQFIYIFCRTTG